MDIRQLKYLDEVVKHRTISRAANALYVSQPALTISIAKLEEELGFKVLQKGEGGYELTEAGTRFYAHVKLVLTTFTNMEEDIEYINKKGSGQLKIGVTEDFRSVIPELFELFLNKNNNFDIKLNEGNTGDMITQLRLNEIHLCLTPLRYLDEDMESIYLKKNKFSLLVRREDVDKYEEEKDLSIFQNTNFIYTEGSYALTKFLKDRHLKFKNIIRVDSIGAAVRLVKKGLGISVLPEIYSKNYTDEEVKSLELRFDLYGPDLYLSYMKRHHLPPAVQEFIEDCGRYISEKV